MSKPIGALVTLQWTDTKETIERYFSFGQWNDDDNEDEYGVPDDAIFFYAFEGEPQLEKMQFSPEHDFLVVKWVLCHDLEMALNYCVNRTPY